MWLKYLTVIILFYIFDILQNSFFVHFNLFGTVPNLVFVLFFSLVFFSTKSGQAPGWENVFYALLAGLILDISSYTYLGVSMILLLVIALFVKKTQTLLQEKKNDKFPFAYFLSLFFISIVAYELLFMIFLDKFNTARLLAGLNRGFIIEIIYNLIIASAIFYIYKKYFKSGHDDRQLKLFSK